MSSIVIALPPISEQKKILCFLDHETANIDALIAEQQRLIELLKEKRQAVISHAVTKGLDPNAPMKDSGVEWLGDVPEHWGVGRLKNLWTVIDCKHVTAEFVDDGFPLASIREVQSRYIDLENAKKTTDHFYQQLISEGRKPEAGDLIVSRNATVGEIAEVSNKSPIFAMGQDVCLLKKNHENSSTGFMYFLFKSLLITLQISSLMVGSTFKRINVEDIRNLIITLPPDSEQSEIFSFVDDQSCFFDSLISEAHQGIDLLKERRSALISAAVTGKIDVRGWQPPATAATTPQGQQQILFDD